MTQTLYIYEISRRLAIYICLYIWCCAAGQPDDARHLTCELLFACCFTGFHVGSFLGWTKYVLPVGMYLYLCLYVCVWRRTCLALNGSIDRADAIYVYKTTSTKLRSARIEFDKPLSHIYLPYWSRRCAATTLIDWSQRLWCEWRAHKRDVGQSDVLFLSLSALALYVVKDKLEKCWEAARLQRQSYIYI